MNIKEVTLQSTVFDFVIVLLILHTSAINTTSNSAYITGGPGSTNVQIISNVTDTATGTISIPGAGDLTAIAITPNNNTAYVCDSNAGANKVYVLNLTNNTLTTTLTSSFNTPIWGAVTPDGNYAYILNSGTAGSGIGMTVIATATNTVFGPFSLTHQPIMLVINSIGTAAYIAALNAHVVTPVNITNPTSPVVGTDITVTGAANLVNIVSAPNSTTAYVTDLNAVIWPINNIATSPTIGSSISTVGSAGDAQGMVITPNGNTLYLALPGTSQVAVIKNVNSTPSPPSYISLTGAQFPAITADGSYVYMPRGGTNSVSVISTASNSVIATISYSIATEPYAAAITTGGSGILDTTFGNRGITLTPISRQDQLTQSTIDSNNNTIVTGITQTVGGTVPTLSPSLLLARYTSSGILDITFNSSGSTPGIQTLLAGSRSEGYGVVLDANSKILVSGMSIQNNQTNMLLARYLTTGAIDTSFNTVGYVTQLVGSGAIANAVGVQSTGKIIVAGCSINGGSPNFTLARFTSTGALDATFGTSGITTTPIGNSSTISAISIITAATNTDDIIAVGNFDNHIAIARYTAAGILDSTFGTGGIFKPSITGASSTIAYDVSLDASSNIIVAGSALISGTNESLLMRLTPSGAFDTSFNTVGYVTQAISGGSEFFTTTLQFNQLILAGGYAIGTLTNQISLARYLNSGAIDTSYGTNGIALTTDGNVAYASSLNIASSGYCVAAGVADGTVSLERYTS